GTALARLARSAGMRVVAVCERDDQRRDPAAAALGVPAYRDLEPFLDHPMEAVILVHDLDQHAPGAIQAPDRGLSGLSETAPYRPSSPSPLAAVTGRRLVQGSGFAVPSGDPAALQRARRGRGCAALLVARLESGAVCKSLHGSLEESQTSCVRITGDRRLMEN